MIHSEGSNDKFSPNSRSHEEKELSSKQKITNDQKKYAVIDQQVRVALLRRILSKESTIKEAAKEFGLNFSTAKAILQTYRKEGRIGKKKNRQRNRKQQPIEATPNSTRRVQSMYDLEREPQMIQQSNINVQDTSAIQNQLLYQQQLQMLAQQRMIMSSPNLDETGTQIALAYYQRELNRQKLINVQLIMMIQQSQQQQLPQASQTEEK